MAVKEQVAEEVKEPAAEPVAAADKTDAQADAAGGDGEAAVAESPAEENPAPKARRGSGPALTLALLVAAGAAGGGYYLWDRQERGRLEATQARADLAGEIGALRAGQSALQDAVRSEIATLGEQLRGLQEAFSNAGAERQALEQRVENTLRRIEAQAGDERRAWIVAEAEYLLRIANRRLQLEADVDSAIAALGAADQRLQEVADPAFLPVRRAISEEITALRALGRSDIEGAALELASVAAAVAELPLKESFARSPFATRQEAAGDTPRQVQDWRQFLAAVWEDIKGLVTVRHEPPTLVPRLPPEQQYFLRQNLVLKLEAARLALLERRAQLYQAALDEAAAWLNTYFDTDAPAIAGALQSIGELRTLPVAPPLPDITTSLRQLQAASDRLRRREGGGGSQ